MDLPQDAGIDVELQDHDPAWFEAPLKREFDALMTAGTYTKRSALRIAIIRSIEASKPAARSRLPSEQRLAELLDASLGTVQAALKQLVDRGYVSRRRGDGTRVLDRSTLPSSFWHVRIADPRTGKPLRIESEALVLGHVAEDSPWEHVRGLKPGMPMIRRTFVYQTNIRVAQEIYVPLDVIRKIEHMGVTELQYTNIREILFPESTAPSTTQRRQLVRLLELPKTLASLHDLPGGRPYLEIQAQVSNAAGDTLYIQRIYAPADTCGLLF